MATLEDLEKTVWRKMEASMAKRDMISLAALNGIALELNQLKQRVGELATKVADLGSANGSHTFPPSGEVAPKQAPRDLSVRQLSSGAGANYTNRPIRAYTLSGTKTFVRTYKELLIGLCNTLRRKHGTNFDELALQLGGRKRRYFARSERILKYAHELDGGNLFAETNLNSNLIVHNICIPLIERLEPGSSFDID
jgi:hypothetical protein